MVCIPGKVDAQEAAPFQGAADGEPVAKKEAPVSACWRRGLYPKLLASERLAVDS